MIRRHREERARRQMRSTRPWSPCRRHKCESFASYTDRRPLAAAARFRLEGGADFDLGYFGSATELPLTRAWPSGLRIELENAQFLIATAGLGDARGPGDGLFGRRQFEHGETAIE